MSHRTTSAAPESTVHWEALEAWARGRIQTFLQALLEEEVTVLLGRRKFERRVFAVSENGSAEWGQLAYS